MMSDNGNDEGDKLARLLAKCPSLAKAFDGSQVTFDDQAKPTNDDVLFITRVTDAPVQVEGRLGPDGAWRITSYHIPTGVEDEAGVEAAIAKEADDEMLVLVDGIGEAMVRYVIPRILGRLTHPEARACFMRRLAQSRFAAAVTIH